MKWWLTLVMVVNFEVVMTSRGNPLQETPTNEVNHGLHSIRDSALCSRGCGTRHNSFLKRVFFNNRSVTCNDGSTAGYYIRRFNGSRRWIIYLEGGWYCFDLQSCHNRWTRLRNLMTSRLWPELRQVGGILSADREENPYWWNANHVLVPYCSSDSWSGSFYSNTSEQLSFLGSEIILQVIRELLPHGLFHSRKVYLVGSSAGGTGVIINLDRVADALRRWGCSADVRGIADSGWFLDNEPFNPVTCTDAHTCAPIEAIKLGIKFWNGQVPDRCRQELVLSDWWKCYFGYQVYRTMQTPLFVFQWLFDEAQMAADNVGTPVTKAQWDYIHKMGHLLRKTLNNVTATFAPSCISHVVLTKRDWQNIKINDVTLPQAIRCWEEYDNRSKRRQQRLLRRNFNKSLALNLHADSSIRHRERKRMRNRGFRLNSTSTVAPRKGHRKKNRRRNRSKNKTTSEKPQMEAAQISSKRNEFAHCKLHYVDECSWPQCNRACPKLRNPFTGEEMDFIELLKSFGLDMKSVATALGTDLETLQTMGNDHLLHILTQTTSK